MHVLDNEVPELHRDSIEASSSKYQLMPPSNHRSKIAERAIRTCKDHFIRMLMGIAAKFPMYMWDHLIQKANITVNLLRQSNAHPHISAWIHYNGAFYCNATPMDPCRM